MAYWWKSPSMARWAASRISLGGGKLGIPWARLIPSCWLLMRVISRMTDSVNPWTRFEITAGSGGSASSGYGRNDGHLVARLELRLRALEEADVLLVDVEVDEAAHLAAFVHETLLHPGILLFEPVDEITHVCGVDLHLGLSLRQRTERRGNSYEHCHWHSPSPSVGDLSPRLPSTIRTG